jgi:hypothetical protein
MRDVVTGAVVSAGQDYAVDQVRAFEILATDEGTEANRLTGCIAHIQALHFTQLSDDTQSC